MTPEHQFPDWAKVGTKIRAAAGHPLVHVRGLVDDQIIVREWDRVRQCWRYQPLDPDWVFVYRNHIEVVP